MKSKKQTAEFLPKPVAQRHHLVSGTLALLRYLVIYMNVKQGSSPDREQSPVEWGEIPFVCPLVRPSVRLPRGLSQAQGGPSQAMEGQIQALGGPSQAVGSQSQAMEGQIQAQGGLSQALGSLF